MSTCPFYWVFSLKSHTHTNRERAKLVIRFNFNVFKSQRIPTQRGVKLHYVSMYPLGTVI